MSPINQLSILALAAGALAVPSFRNVDHQHGHQHLHSSYLSGSAVTASSESASSTAFPTLSTFSAVGKAYRQRTKSSKSSTSTSTSVYVAPTTAATSTAAATTQAATSSAAAVATSSGSGKRGLAYNDASLTHYFSGSQVTWAYNWASATTNLLSGLKFIPLLWGTGAEFTTPWAVNAAAAIATGSEYLFSFNEPDLSSQSNLSPAQAAAAYKTYMQPFAGKAKLCAPSVTNGGGAMGLTWLSEFLAACDGCTIDCLNIHWYDSYTNVAYFKQHVSDAIALGKPVFLSEFGTVDGSDANKSSFLQQVMPWLDDNDSVLGYSYFMVSQGLLVSGTGLSGFGNTYMTYTG